MIPSFNLNETGFFLIEVLGFEEVFSSKEYAIYERNQCMIHLLNAGSDIGQMEFYLEINNIDKLWEDIQNRIVGLKVKPPFKTDYGMKELHIEIPQTNALMFVGEKITN